MCVETAVRHHVITHPVFRQGLNNVRAIFAIVRHSVCSCDLDLDLNLMTLIYWLDQGIQMI